MTEKEFWQLTPAKLSALLSKHNEINGLSDKEQNTEAINQLLEP